MMVVNHPDILVLCIAKGPQYERRNKMAKLLKVALGIAVGEKDIRHAARPLHRIHFIAVELGVSRPRLAVVVRLLRISRS